MNFSKIVDSKIPLKAKLIKYKKTNPNYLILEYTKNVEGNWKKYEKTGGVWAFRLESKTYIKSLENKTGKITGKQGDWLLMNEQSKERWFMSNKDFKKKFKNSGSDDTHIDEDKRVYKWYERIPGSAVLAMPMYKPFQVIHERSDEPLQGKTGDYIVKNFKDINNPDPKDVWIVDKKIFEKTYKELL